MTQTTKRNSGKNPIQIELVGYSPKMLNFWIRWRCAGHFGLKSSLGPARNRSRVVQIELMVAARGFPPRRYGWCCWRPGCIFVHDAGQARHEHIRDMADFRAEAVEVASAIS